MKKNILTACALALAGLAASVQPGNAQPVATTPAYNSASKTSFTEVTSQLDPGGNFYLYLGTAQWLERLSGKVENWRGTFTSMPDLKPEDTANINKAFDIITRVIRDSGVEDISGFGLSSVEIEPGLYRNKALLHHYPGTGTGFLWKLGGGAPHPLTGLDLCPANTALAIFSDADLPLLWNTVTNEVAQSDIPQANEFLQQLPDQFEQNTQVKWDAFINSIGGEFGLVVTLNETNTVPIPLPSGLIQIPEPGILIVVKVNDDTIFNRIDQQLKQNPQIISVDDGGLKMRTMPVPIPMVMTLRPSVASSGGYLLIASSDSVIQEALAVKAGGEPGLKSTAEFKRLSQGIPDTGNQFSFVSAKFGQAVIEIQKQMITGAAERNGGGPQMDWMNSLMNPNRATFSYSVGMNTPDGCLTIANANQSAANLVLIPAVAVPGMLAAIAIPNFVKARTTSQQNACINNLRQIDAAENQWALEQQKKTGDICTADDLKPYIRLVNGELPKCPAGGTYTINPVGQPPTCSVPGHVLP
jgi:hypothetical protein